MKEDNSSHTNDIDMLMPTEDEQHELRMALGRASRPQPDVEAELERFANANFVRPNAKPWVKPLARLCAAAAAVALTLLVVKPLTAEKQQIPLYETEKSVYTERIPGIAALSQKQQSRL